MASLTFYPARLSGAAAVPPSKSEAHRALVLAALGEGACRLHGLPDPLCDDLKATVRGVRALGACVERESENVLLVTPGQAPQTARVDVGACGTTLRMLIPAFLSRGCKVRMLMDAPLARRPLETLMDFASRGLTIRRGETDGRAWVEAEGLLTEGEYEADGTISSQLVSGLLMALPGESRVKVRGPIASRPYLELTCWQMRRFGREVAQVREGVFDLAPRKGASPEDLHIGGDWSQAAALLCASALGSGVWVTGLDAQTVQGDAKITSLLTQMGLLLYHLREGLYVVNPSHAALWPMECNMMETPDIAPLTALLCTRALGVSRLSGLSALQSKECDRLAATCELLCALGAEIRAEKDGLTIRGGAPLRGGVTVDSHGDHRMVILVSIAALGCEQPVTVTGVEALDKSWPEYLSLYRALGGRAE